MNTKNEYVEINIKGILKVLLHKIYFIILSAILFASAAAYLSYYRLTPMYTSETSIYVINREAERELTLADLQTGTQLTKDYMIIVKSRPVMEQIIRDLGLTISYEELVGGISVSTPEDSRILKITATFHDAVIARDIADAVARVSIERMVGVMGMEEVNVVEPANLPQAPSSPNTTKNTVYGGILGAMVAGFFIVLVYLLNDTIKTIEDVEKYLGITTLSSIPAEEVSSKKIKEKKERSRGKQKKSALAS